MDYRIRNVPPAAWRIVRAKAGDRLPEGLRRLIELWAEGAVDPLSDQTPAAQLAARGGYGRAAQMTADERAASARTAASARWKDHIKAPR